MACHTKRKGENQILGRTSFSFPFALLSDSPWFLSTTQPMTPFMHKRVANDPTTNWPALFLTAILQLNGRTRCIQQTLQPASVGDDAVSTSYHGWLTCHMMGVSILERPYLQLMISATHDTGVNEWHWSRKAIMQDWRYSIHHGWCIAMALLKDDQQWYVTFTVTAEHESAAATTMSSIDQQ